MTRCYASFGAGTQSTALAMLAVNRDPRLLEVTDGVVPEVYIFADTGDEPAAVYAHLEEMKALIPVTVCGHKDGVFLSEMIDRAKSGETGGMATPPVFVAGKDGRGAPVRRTCTSDFKTKPIERTAKERFGVIRGKPPATGRVIEWLGISYDERQRQKYRTDKWRTTWHPLVDMLWTRGHCEDYIRQQVYADGSPMAVVRSACTFCPFRSRSEWAALTPDEFDEAVSVEGLIHDAHTANGKYAGIKGKPFLHRSLSPLDEVDLTDPDEDQEGFSFDDECAGVCGV